MSASRVFLFFAATCTLFPYLLRASDCPSLPPDINSRIEHYLAKRLVSGANVKPLIASMEQLPHNCFRKVSITVPKAALPVVLYLSPDGRYLTSVVYDLSEDPNAEVARIASNVRSLLMRDQSPQRSGQHARITLVEFGDMQCPFCKRFAEWYQSLPDSSREQTALVYKHMPLPQHAWARSAALFGACVSLQSTSAFWQLSDFLLQNQSDITLDNFEAKAISALTQAAKIDVQELQLCIKNGTGAAIVDRDLMVAKELNVRSTPTVFVDGRRVLSVSSQEDLNELIEHELRAGSPPRSDGGQQ